MSMTAYNYTKAILVDQLSLEIRGSAIVTALDHIDTLGSSVTIYFKDALSDSDKTTLDSLVTVHTPNPSQLSPPSDTDNAPLLRMKTAPVGWTYQAHPFEFQTSVLGSVYSKKPDGTDHGFCTLKFYDGNGVLLTQQSDLDSGCVKTQVDWEPTFDYEIISGRLYVKDQVTDDMRLFVVAVPDVPAGSGGSKVMISGINLSFIEPYQAVEADGRTSKHMTYNGVYHTNKIRFLITHSAGVKHKFQVMVELYRL